MTTLPTWTGSEHHRRRWGVVLPPTQPPNTAPRFSIAPGTPCEVRRVVDPLDAWRRHVTTKPVEFERYESYRDRHYTFRDAGWLLRVHRRHVDHRAESPLFVSVATTSTTCSGEVV